MDKQTGKTKVEKIVAVLDKDIEFINYDQEHIMLAAGTKIAVDTKRGIAYFDDDHFDVIPSEYHLIN